MVSVKCPAEDRREQGMESLDTIFELCKEAGVHEQAVIPVEKIKFSDEVRHLCEVNYCGSYGKTWACPPGVGSVEECREKCMAFTQVYIFYHMASAGGFPGSGWDAGREGGSRRGLCQSA